jgi:hypothetical protein
VSEKAMLSANVKRRAVLYLFFVWVFSAQVQRGLAAESSFAVSITAQSMPASLGTLGLIVDGTPRSILPAIIEVSLAPWRKTQSGYLGKRLPALFFCTREVRHRSSVGTIYG